MIVTYPLPDGDSWPNEPKRPTGVLSKKLSDAFDEQVELESVICRIEDNILVTLYCELTTKRESLQEAPADFEKSVTERDNDGWGMP